MRVIEIVKGVCLLLLLCGLSIGFANGQSIVISDENNTSEHQINIQIPAVSLVAVRGLSGNSITLSPQAPFEAGGDFSTLTASDSSLWLNYSNIRLSGLHPYRQVYVRVASGSIPSGFAVTLNASPSNGSNAVTQGTPVGEIQLSTNDVKLIGQIPTSYTGFGVGNGHRLTYSIHPIVGRTHLINFDQSTSLQVLYTIAD